MRISDNQRLILGPPGTGKTTYVLNSIENLLEKGVPPDRIAFVSFTRKAIGEATSRACDRFKLKQNQLPLFKTIHSHCFNALGISKKDVMGREQYRELGEWLGYKFEGTWDESEGVPVGSEMGDTLLFLDNLARITNRPLKEIWEENYQQCEWDELERFQDAYQDFKSANNVMDFTDMLYAYVSMCDPSRADYVFVDEAQDLSAAQWMVLKHAFAGVVQTSIAGDDDQSIYKWSGADVNTFLALEGEQHILNQSYRLPKEIHNMATTLVSRIENRFDKQFKSRNTDGIVDFISLLDFAEINNEESSLILFRNAYLANRVIQHLQRLGIPYHYKGYNSIRTGHITAIYAVEKLRKNQAITGAEAKTMYEWMRVGYFLKHGFKTKIGVLGDKDEFTYEKLNQQYGLKDLSQWYNMLEAIPQPVIDYYRAVLSNGYKLTHAPKCTISTVHAAKGGEADHVIVLSDMAQRSYREYEKSPDDERRVAYVAITRAKEKLTIIQPQSKYYFDYYLEGVA
jgi:DNA helicase-2/ATP-dependent DNA helicase PcrA